MGKIFKEIGILGSNNRYKTLKALFDTGATHNYIAEKFEDGSSVHDLGIIEFLEKQSIIFPNGSEMEGQMIKLKLLKIKGTRPIEEPSFCLFNMKMCDIIIGAKLMQQLGMILNPSIKEISFPSQ